jgi:tetratricopeptide (TPR) repeat protein
LLGQVLESQGRLDEALQVYQEAIPLRAELVKLAPQDYAFRRKWINSLMNQGLIHKAKFYQGALIHYELAQKILGESQHARDELLREMASEAEANLHLDSAMGSYNLLLLQDLTGLISNLEYEIEILEEKSPLDEQQRLELQQLKEDLASLEKSREGWQGRAQNHLLRAFDELDLLLADDAGKMPGYESLTRSRFQLQHLYAECLMQKGRLAKASGENPAAQESYDLAREVLEALVKDNKNSPEYSDALARAYYFISELQFDLYEDEAALKAIDKAIELWNALGSSHAQQLADAINFRGEITDAIEKASADSKATEDKGPEDQKAKETLPNDTNTSRAGTPVSSAP